MARWALVFASHCNGGSFRSGERYGVPHVDLMMVDLGVRLLDGAVLPAYLPLELQPLNVRPGERHADGGRDIRVSVRRVHADVERRTVHVVVVRSLDDAAGVNARRASYDV